MLQFADDESIGGHYIVIVTPVDAFAVPTAQRALCSQTTTVPAAMPAISHTCSIGSK